MFRRTFPLTRSVLCAFALLLLATPRAEAQQATSDVSALDGEGWDLTVTPFAWGAEQRGTVTARGVEASADIDFSDLLDVADVVAAMGFEARRGRFALQLDGLYLDIEEEVDGRLLDIDVGLEQLIMQSFAKYRVLEEPFQLELLGGARYYRLETEIDFARLPLDSEQDRDWLDPLVGMSLATDLTDALQFTFRGDFGGFGVGSDRMWSAAGTFIYRMNDRWKLHLGYNILSLDYDDGSGSDLFEYNVKQRGPVLAFSYRF